MIAGALITESPFGLANLHWCEGRFTVTAATAISLGGVTVTLPDALYSAVPKRRSAFLAGRLCAAHALRAAGLPQVVGLQGRAPVWPHGVVGSISHSDNQVIAVVSRDYDGLGVDIEPLMTPAQAQDIHSLILTPAEIALRPAKIEFPAFLTLMFSAKESLYKALSARLSQMPSFLDVTVLALTPDSVNLCLGTHNLTAHYILSETGVVTLVTVSHPVKGTA